jgi:hypothetical protein
MTLPAPDLDALIERLLRYSIRINGELMMEQAAAALAELREENALIGHPPAQIQKLERRAERAESSLSAAMERIAALEAENARLVVEFRKVEVLWKEAAIDASRKHDTISGLENACRISLYRADALQAENRLLRECARTPDLERIDAAIDAAREKP